MVCRIINFKKGNCTLDEQKKIESELFKEYDKNIDRSFSLLKFIFAVIGIYPLLSSKITNNTLNTESIPLELSFCIIAIIIAFYNIIIILLERKSKLKKDNSIHFRKGEELKNYNEEMYSALKKQHIRYITSIFCIVASLTFFYSYIVQGLFGYFCKSFIIVLFSSFVAYHFPQVTDYMTGLIHGPSIQTLITCCKENKYVTNDTVFDYHTNTNRL